MSKNRFGARRLAGIILAFTFSTVVLAAPAPGDALKPFALRTLGGTPWAWRPGRTTVLTFCAFWCDTWKTQLPRVAETRRATQGLPVDYATISVDGRWSDVARSVAVGAMLADPGGAWIRQVGIDRVPYTLIVSPSGKVAWAGYGTLRTQALTDAVRAATASRPEAGTVYLTFDDFPAKEGSHELLDALRAVGVPATFFCIGSHVGPMADVLRRAVREGHRLQIHSWAHDGDHPELSRCVSALQQVTGVKPDLYRPPGSERLMTLDGKPLTLPIDDPYDYTRPGANEVARRVLLAARPGAVIQLHVGVRDTVDALPRIVKNLRARGFAFGVLGGADAP